jgi:hypothetical protein
MAEAHVDAAVSDVERRMEYASSRAMFPRERDLALAACEAMIGTAAPGRALTRMQPAAFVETALAAKATIGESPVWAPAEQALYWIDIKAPALHRSRLEAARSRHGR